MTNNAEDVTKYQNDYYASYLLQIWFDQQFGGWQFKLCSIQDGSEWRVESLQAMVQCLQTQMGEQASNS